MSIIPTSHVGIYMLHTRRLGTQISHSLIRSSIVAIANYLNHALIIDLLSFSQQKSMVCPLVQGKFKSGHNEAILECQGPSNCGNALELMHIYPSKSGSLDQPTLVCSHGFDR